MMPLPLLLYFSSSFFFSLLLLYYQVVRSPPVSAICGRVRWTRGGLHMLALSDLLLLAAAAADLFRWSPDQPCE
jgi:hypothetical protein